MAHSNRKKLREARGGKTRNQLRKAQRASNSTSQSARLAQTIAWMASNEEKRRAKQPAANEPAKVKTYAKDSRTVERRKRTVKRLEHQLKTDGHPLKFLKENDKEGYAKAVARIKKELETLKSRI